MIKVSERALVHFSRLLTFLPKAPIAEVHSTTGADASIKIEVPIWALIPFSRGNVSIAVRRTGHSTKITPVTNERGERQMAPVSTNTLWTHT